MEIKLQLKERVFIKIGGSYITDKTKPDSLIEDRIRQIAKAISLALAEGYLKELILAHGAGSYGHIVAQKYDATAGIHPVHGWQAFYQIRQDMMHMNLRFLQICAAENLFPITVQPSAIMMANAGKISAMNFEIIHLLLDRGQIPLLHGDIIVDEQRGFTIASTENILSFLCRNIPFHRVVMLSDMPGVVDTQGKIIPRITEHNFKKIIMHLGGSKGVDVTGGMKNKVEQLYNLIREGHIIQAHILSGDLAPEELKNAIIGKAEKGTIIRNL